jgi:hypothetical protein
VSCTRRNHIEKKSDPHSPMSKAELARLRRYVEKVMYGPLSAAIDLDKKTLDIGTIPVRELFLRLLNTIDGER